MHGWMHNSRQEAKERQTSLRAHSVSDAFVSCLGFFHSLYVTAVFDFLLLLLPLFVFNPKYFHLFQHLARGKL